MTLLILSKQSSRGVAYVLIGKIGPLFAQLERMAQDGYAHAQTMRISPRIRVFERWFLSVYVVILLLITVLGGLYRYGIANSEIIRVIAFYLSVFLNVFALLGLGGYVSILVRVLWRGKKRVAAGAFEVMSQDVLRDAHYVQELCAYPKSLLEYALVQCRHTWGMAEGRASLLVGDLRKLGLFPTLLVILSVIPKLLESASNLWFWVLPISTVGICLMASYVFGSGERRVHVLGLLQYAIDHSQEDEQAAPVKSGSLESSVCQKVLPVTVTPSDA